MSLHWKFPFATHGRHSDSTALPRCSKDDWAIRWIGYDELFQVPLGQPKSLLLRLRRIFIKIIYIVYVFHFDSNTFKGMSTIFSNFENKRFSIRDFL